MPENFMAQVMSTKRITDAASRLLSTEADYLGAWGWTPHVVRPADLKNEQQAVVQWKKGNDGPLRFQGEAIRIQKAQDPNFAFREVL